MKIKNFFAITLAAALIGITLNAVQAKTIVGIAHTQKETHPDHLGFLAFKDYVEKNAGDKYEVQIYPNKTAGSNEKVIELVRAGSIQFMAISSANLEPYNKKYALFSIPYLFSNEANYEKFITDQSVLEALAENYVEDGFTPLGAFTAGTRSFYAKFPINSPADLAGKTFRVQIGQTNRDIMNCLEAHDLTINFGDVYAAIKSGAVDGAENNELALVEQKHGELCKYYSYDRHQMCPDFIVGSTVFLYSLPEEDFELFKKAALEAEKVEIGKWKECIEAAKKKAIEMGVKFFEVDNQAFRDKVAPVREQLLNNNPEIKPLYEKALSFDNN